MHRAAPSGAYHWRRHPQKKPETKQVSWFLVFSISWFLGFPVSKFLGFLVSNFLGFLVSSFQRFNDPILPNFHFMFQDDIGPIFKIFKK